MTPVSTDNTAALVGALTSAGVIGYDLSQGQTVSATLGPGGASLVQAGPASTQTTIFLVVLGLGLLLLLGYFFIK